MGFTAIDAVCDLQIGSDMGRIAGREHAINTQISGLAADLRAAKQQLSASQQERLQLEETNKDLEVDLNCTVQVCGNIRSQGSILNSVVRTRQILVLMLESIFSKCLLKFTGLQELKTLKSQLEQCSRRLTDSESVSQLSDAMKHIQHDLKRMHVHTGMLQHQVLHTMLANNGYQIQKQSF